MTVTGMDADSTVSKRIAGDSDKRYTLLKMKMVGPFP